MRNKNIFILCLPNCLFSRLSTKIAWKQIVGIVSIPILSNNIKYTGSLKTFVLNT